VLRWFLLSILVFSAWGCQTSGVLIEESNYSVKQHRVAIVQALSHVRNVSENGRVIQSYYHDKNLKYFEPTGKTKIRFYTKVTILGERRPYRIAVEVHIEQRDPVTTRFQNIGLEETLSRRRAFDIKSALNQSRESGGVFDEEAPF
jgi:hypothetical protein